MPSEYGVSVNMNVELVRSRLVQPNGVYAAVDVVDSTGSTNADLVAAARAGAVDRTLLIARTQTAGHGRRSRHWASPAGGLYASVLLRPHSVPPSRLGWLTLLAGIALVELAESVGVPATVKWPNDLLTSGDAGKLAGVLAEAIPAEDGTAVVLGIGLNVLPLPDAANVPNGVGGLPPASLAECGARVTALDTLAMELFERFAELDSAWRAAAGDVEAAGLRDRYLRRCATIGRRVRVDVTDAEVTGIAEDVDSDGQLTLALDSADGGGVRTLSAGDVVHLRAP